LALKTISERLAAYPNLLEKSECATLVILFIEITINKERGKIRIAIKDTNILNFNFLLFNMLVKSTL